MKDSITVYEVWRSTPLGEVSMGLYLTSKSAEEVAKKFNKTVTCDWDKAKITKRKVLK